MVLILIDPTPEELEAHKKFPSPCGDYGSYLPTGKNGTPSLIISFPSPYGDYGSYLDEEVKEKVKKRAEVSVPLRGLWFLSYMTSMYIPLTTTLCFRPLAGIMVLIANETMLQLRRTTSFRPLTGIMVLIPNVGYREIFGLSAEVSVPLRGLWFLS